MSHPRPGAVAHGSSASLSARKDRSRSRAKRGTVLIVVLWVLVILSFVCVSFARDMALEMDSSRYFIDATRARLAASSAVAHARVALATYEPDLSAPSAPALLDDAEKFRYVAVTEASVGGLGAGTTTAQPTARYYLLGGNYESDDQLVFGLVDEAAKLNVNTAPWESLARLPEMTDEVAQAIVDFRDADSEPLPYGAEDEYYGSLEKPYRAKNAPFETLEELLLVKGVTASVLYGEDTDRNGVLDPWENDGDASPPEDDRDGELDRGLAAYVTVYSFDPNVNSQGGARLNIATASREEVEEPLLEGIAASLLQQIFAALEQTTGGTIGADTPGGGRGAGPGTSPPAGQTAQAGGSISSMADLLARVPDLLERENRQALGFLLDVATVSEEEEFPGLVNVNTAPKAVLAALPGMDEETAEAIDAYRQQGGGDFSSVAWLLDVEQFGAQRFFQLLPLITSRSFQYRVQAVGVAGSRNAFCRLDVVLDRSKQGIPAVSWRDVTAWGAPFDFRAEAEKTR